MRIKNKWGGVEERIRMLVRNVIPLIKYSPSQKDELKTDILLI